MNEKITAFLDEVCRHIKYKKIHEEIRAELTEHILENAENGNICIEEAILQMGNSVEIGERLNKEHKPQTEWSIIVLGAMISLIGGIIMYLSSKFEDFRAVNFGRYSICAVIGLIVLIALYFFDYTKLKKLSLPIYCTALLFFFAIKIFGNNGNSMMYLRIGGIAISGEYAVFLFSIAFVGFIEKYRGQGGFAIIKLIILGVISVLPLMSLYNSSLIIVMMISYAVLTLTAIIRNHFGGSKKAQLISMGVLSTVGIGLIALYIVVNSYLVGRISAFLARGQNDPGGYGWQQMLADKLLSLSNWFGKANTTGTWYGMNFYLPGVTSQYVLINVIATLGWAVGIALIIIVALFILRMFMTIRKVKTDYGFYLSLSACVILSAQFIINILMNFGLLPVTSINMPFVSYGGTGYIISMALVGIILSVWRRNNLVSNIKTPLQKRINRIKFQDGKLTINFNRHIN